MKALQMSLEQDLKRVKKNKQHAQEAREKSAKLHAQAVLLVGEFSHTGPTKQAMWAVAKIGLDKCREIAAANLSPYLFRKKVAGG